MNLRLQGGPDVVRFDLQDVGRGTEEGGNLQWRVDWKTGLRKLDLTLFREGEYGWLFVDTDVSRLDHDRVGLQLPGIDNTDEEWVFAPGYK